MIDRRHAAAFDEEPLLDAAEEIIERDLGGRGFQRDVRHARKGDARPVIRVQAAVRLLLPHQRRQLARGLPVDEHAVADNVPPLRLHTLIVITRGGQPAGLRAVADQMHDLRAEPQPAGIGRLHETRARHVRFVAKRAIELSGVPDRFVDRQEQLRRIDDDVEAAGGDGFGGQLLDDFVAGLLGILEPRIILDILVTEQLGTIDHGARLEISGIAIGGGRGELRIRAHQALRDPRALARCEIFLLVHELDLRVDEAHAFDGHRRLVQLHQERRLGFERHLERIATDGIVPVRDHLVGGGEHDLARLQNRVGPGDGDRLLGDQTRRCRIHRVRGGKAPRAVHQHAQAHAVARRTRDVLHLPFARRDRLAAIAVDADVGVRCAERGRSRQSHVRGLGAGRVRGSAGLEGLGPVGRIRRRDQRTAGRDEFSS